MKKDEFEHKVHKHLWFLNRAEKKCLNEQLTRYDPTSDHLNPISYANAFLKRYIFKNKRMTVGTLYCLLIGLLCSSIIFVGLFLFGFLLSIYAVNTLLTSDGSLSRGLTLLLIPGSCLIIFVSLFLLRASVRYFTKRLVEYKFNRYS